MMWPRAGSGGGANRDACSLDRLAEHQAGLDRPGAVNDVAAGDYGFTYDGNGNVVQVVNVSDYGVGNFWWQAVRTMAVYEYDAYGHVIGPDTSGDGQFDELDDVGPYAAENPMRFSTKYFDRETGLGYWGYRYYSPALGRWVSRDPLEEMGGWNLFAFTRNGPMARWDPLGERCIGSTDEDGDSAGEKKPCDPATCFEIKPKKLKKCTAKLLGKTGACPNVSDSAIEGGACDRLKEMVAEAKKTKEPVKQSCGGSCTCSDKKAFSDRATITDTRTDNICWTPGKTLGDRWPDIHDCKNPPPGALICIVTLAITATVEGEGWYGVCTPNPETQPTTQPETRPAEAGDRDPCRCR